MTPTVTTLPVSVIRPNDWNPNAMTPALKKALVENIRRVGFVQPILVRQEHVDVSSVGEEPGSQTVPGGYEIVDGEHRFHAAIECGYTEVPVVLVDASTSEAKAQTVAMNRLRGTMEPADLAKLIREVESDGLDLAELAEFTGYSHDELTRTVSLLDFDWQQYAGEPGATRERASSGGETDAWVTLAYRVPAEVARIFAEQVGRIRRLAGDIPDHMAIEAIAALALASPDDDFTT